MMDTLTFLRTILPEDGYKYVGLSRAGSSGIAHKAYDSLETMAQAIALDDKQTNLTVYHACAAYKEPYFEIEVDGALKKKYRGQQNWYKAKSFWADIDCGESKAAEGKGYATKKDAATAIISFCRINNIPDPMLVDSGGGIHCYWPLTQPIGPNSWRTIASSFKAALAGAGLLVDPTRTADLSSVLRPVGSHNRKPGRDVRQVKVVRDGSPITPQEFHTAIKAAVTKYNVIPPRISQAANLNDDLIAHLGPQLESSADEAANHCNQMRVMRDTQGDVNYETWRGVIGIIKHCVEGESLAYEWSKRRGETGHSNTDVHTRYQSWSSGPTTCAFFESCNPNDCVDCSQKGKITSPIQLGRFSLKQTETGTGKLSGRLVTWDPNAPRPAKREFLINDGGLFPLMAVSTLAGLGGSMKSAMAIMLGLYGALGQAWNGWQVPAGQTLILSGEDDASEFQRRVGGYAKTCFQGEDLLLIQRRVHCLPLSGLGYRLTEMVAGTPKMTIFVEEVVKVINGLNANGQPFVRLVVVDHARLLIGGDLNVSEHATAGMEACMRIALETGAAVILIAHSPKSAASPGRKASDFGVNDVLGSGAFVDNSRFSVAMTPLVEDEQKKLGLSAETGKEYLAFRIIKSNYSEAGRVIYLKKSTVPNWGVAFPAPIQLSTSLKSAPSSLVDRVVAAVVAAPGRYTRSKLRDQSGSDGPFKASDKKLRLAIDEAITTERVIERPATPQDVSAHNVRLRDRVLDVGVGNVP